MLASIGRPRIDPDAYRRWMKDHPEKSRLQPLKISPPGQRHLNMYEFNLPISFSKLFSPPVCFQSEARGSGRNEAKPVGGYRAQARKEKGLFP